MLEPHKQRVSVLVTVKASPQPSRTYGDTVCVAGIALDDDGTPQQLIRLYPVPFRSMAGERQFKKYQRITVTTSVNPKDGRPESRRIDAESLVLRETIPPWAQRVPYVEPFVTEDMCAVLEAVRGDLNAPSLAVIRPLRIDGLDVEPNPGWSPAQQASLDAWMSQPDLFGEKASREILEAPRFKARYRYACHAVRCRGHRQGVLDWELTALQRHVAGDSDAVAIDKIRRRFLDEMCKPSQSTAFFVGNQENPRKRATFSVLGTYYPKASEAGALPLF